MKRKTHTSSEVKDRWNRSHYDQIMIRVPIGAREEIQRVADARGMSVAAYIRHLILTDTEKNPESTHFLRGGGVLTPEEWRAFLKKLV